MRKDKKVLNLLLCQEWVEYERGWGSRPDGCSLHRTQDDHKAFCEAYWARMPDGYVPDEYSAENGQPYLAVVETILYGSVVNGNGRGLWVSSSAMRSGQVRRATPDEILSVHSQYAGKGA